MCIIGKEKKKKKRDLITQLNFKFKFSNPQKAPPCAKTTLNDVLDMKIGPTSSTVGARKN